MILFTIILFSMLLVSIWWWFFDTETRDRMHESIFIAVVYGAFMCLVMFWAFGIEHFLVFIPDDWGRFDEGGDFVTTRSSIALLIAILLSVFLFYVFGKFEKLRTENKRLSEHAAVIQKEMTIIAEIQKRKDDLRYRSHKKLIKKRGKIEAALQRLREPSSNSWTELRIMEALLDEVNYLIEVTKPNALNKKDYDEEDYPLYG